jgi:hypothetical protein
MKKRLLFFILGMFLLAGTGNAFQIVQGPNRGKVAAHPIGVAGTMGFGVGTCPVALLPPGMIPMVGTYQPGHSNYGNYNYNGVAQCVFIPRFYYKITAGAGTAIDIKGTDTYANEAAANAADYAIHRAFIDGGIEQVGFFVDKFENSKVAWGTGYIAGSKKNGLPISTASTHNSIADLTACTVNQYYEAINAAHARDGVNGAVNALSIWHVQSRFQWSALAMLSLAHGQAVTDTTWAAWYNATYNYPLGLNNNNLANADVDVSGLVYTWDNFAATSSGKAGSGVPFNKTTHNGQACGVADLNGNMYEINIGMTCIASTMAITGASQADPCVITVADTSALTTGDWIMITVVVGMTELNNKMYKITVINGTTFSLDGIDSSGYTAWDSAGTITYGNWYAANESTAMKTFTSSDLGATDHWGATGVAALMTEMTMSAMPFESGGAFVQRYGSSTNQVLDEATSGDGWILTGLGLPQDSDAIDTTGTNQFGKDYFYQYVRDKLCVLSGGLWNYGSFAGVWHVVWSYYRSVSVYGVGFRLACVPE